MLNSWIEFRRARQLIGALALSLALVCGLTPASAADAHSSPADRARFVSITRSLEADPLKSSGKADREWALNWLTEAPDVSVTVCGDALGGVIKSDYRYAGEILFQYMFSMAALVIEHPESTNDPDAQQLAGVKGALNAYRAILRDEPDAKSPALETLLQTQARGQLPDFIRKADCSAKK